MSRKVEDERVFLVEGTLSKGLMTENMASAVN